MKKTKKFFETNVGKYLITLVIGMAFCFLWIFLEYFIKGKITDDPVDNIIMSIVMVFIWYTVSYFQLVAKIRRINKNETDRLN